MIESQADDAATGRSHALRAARTVRAEPSKEIWFSRRIQVGPALRELWQFRPLIRALAERDIRIRYKQAAFGIAWAIFTPVVLMLAFTLVFTKFGHVDTHGVPYPLFSYVGLIPWSFFSSAVLAGGASLSGNLALLNKLYCPREVFPLGTIVVAAVDAVVSTIVLVALFIIESYPPSWQTVYLPIPLLILVAFTLGVTLAIAAATVYMRDLRIALPLMMQLGLFVTPVAYGIGTIASTRAGVILYSALNPLAPVIDGLRRTVLLGVAPDWASTAAGATTATIVLVAGYLLFKRLETGLADFA